MTDQGEKSPVDNCAEIIRNGIEKAKADDVSSAIAASVLESLAKLKSSHETLGLYLTLLAELVSAHKFIRKGDIEKAVNKLLPEDEKDISNRVSAADEIVALITESCTLFTDQEDEAYATIEQDGHREIWPIKSTTFKDWVSMLLYSAVGKTPRAAALADAFSTLGGLARHEGDKHDVYLRVASDGDGGYYLDIGDDQWRVIHITALGWQITDQSPVMFRRSKASKSIPIPVSGGNLEDLTALVNIDEMDNLILVSAIIECLRPDTAYPVIELIGGQGAGKSTTADHIRRLVDPHAVNLRNAPRSVEDVFVSARNNHFVCLNNLSRLSNDEQDAFCNLSTGGGYASRKLYTNDEETTYEAKRPVLLNGINAVATQPDLVSRIVRVECPEFNEDHEQIDDADIAEIFEKRSPRAMGFLLDTMVSALAILPHVTVTGRPRLMDFAKLGAAIGRVLSSDPDAGELAFTNRYRDARDAASLQALESMPVIAGLIEYLENHAPYTGNYAELLREIEKKVGKSVDAGWPKSGRGMSDAIGRAKPTLDLLGWKVTAAGRGKSGANVTITKKPSSVINDTSAIPNTTSTTSTDTVKGAGGAGGAGENAPTDYHRKDKKTTFPVGQTVANGQGGLL